MLHSIEPSALIGENVTVGENVKIWHFAHLRDLVSVGNNSIIGSGVYIGNAVKIGANCKVQNNAMIYEPAEIKDGVFIGPGVILTNDHNQRAITRQGTVKKADEWEMVGVTVEDGAAIGAGAICVAPVNIGEWAVVAAGAVVTKNVPNHSLVGGIPARHLGWVGRSGFRLLELGEYFECPKTGEKYEIIQGKLQLRGVL